ncbi:aminoglycoside N(3)-acetyltransferase [Aggregatilinea lenta]|uniref:aminoglycoside N(3)-acetyltransferase n=1 Tax=Aggregatilinea lenta TaxID=913108 RepID=UPI000E5C263C|nr:AAC(3) family N-acetyltransferase [Aggregatilinea lenta]
MSELDAIQGSNTPNTITSLAAELAALGVQPGMTVIAHSSLSKLGWVAGGPVAVVYALERVVGPEGTLVMPAHSGDLSDPAEWQNPPVPEVWWEIIRETTPAFDPDLTPTRGMGAIPECFRKQRGVLRSAHPQVSFAAWGKHAEAITQNHLLPYSMGETSPLARIYDLDGWVLLLGVGHSNNTSLHLAEYRADWPGKQVVKLGAPILTGGEQQWTWFDDINTDTDDFPLLGEAFNATGAVKTGSVGRAEALLMSQRALVDFAAAWLAANRRAPDSP